MLVSLERLDVRRDMICIVGLRMITLYLALRPERCPSRKRGLRRALYEYGRSVGRSVVVATAHRRRDERGAGCGKGREAVGLGNLLVELPSR